MAYKVIVLCAVICCAVAAPLATPWSPCTGFSGDITITNVVLPGCNAAPCVLKKGTTVTGSVSFKSSVQQTDVTNKVYGIIAGVPVPFPIPQADACKLNITCPIPANTVVTESPQIPISAAYPSIALTAKWELLDASGKEQGCFEVPFKIES